MRPSLLLSAGLAAAVNGAEDLSGWRNGAKSLYTPKGYPTPRFPHPYKKEAPAPTVSVNPTVPTPNPAYAGACAAVSASVASFTSAHPKSLATPTVPAQLAYECMLSVPFNRSAALSLLDAIRPYLDWQTTIEYLINPPREYRTKVQPPYDFWKYWDNINHNAQVQNYENEYEFGFQLYRLFQMTHDGHFVFIPDSVGRIFNFGRTTPLVSVSLDGQSLPQIFVYSDILKATADKSFKASPVTYINGNDAVEYLLSWSEYGSLQDRDALWNNVFYESAQVSLGPFGTGTGTFAGGGRGRWVYPGPTTALTFENGTTVTSENYAKVLASFEHVQSGEDLYKLYFVPPPGQPESASKLATPAASSSVPVPTSTARPTIPAPGYPKPYIRSPDNLNSGYFLEGNDYDDVAVLSVPSFVGIGTDEQAFQIANTAFLNEAVKRGKKKLIIDVSANGGGTVLQGYDLFKQLFPQILPYGATRFRAHEAFDIIGEEVSYYSGLVPRSLKTNQTVQNIVSTPWNYRSDDNKDYQPFTSWRNKYGPHAHGPSQDNFTSIIRWNLSDVLTPDNSGGIYVSGYLERSNITKQPFAAEDIVIVYDGYCASTCTIFSELMTTQGGVRTIALGGRPNTDIIQAVGGTKGTNDYPYSFILYGVEQPFEIQHFHDAEYYEKRTVLGEYSDLPIFRSIDAVVNARDGIAPNDPLQTPLQFIYQPADCRIFYTPEMVVDETAIWKTVADTAFRGINHCVAGHLPGTSTKRSEKDSGEALPKHPVREELDINEHLHALENVWTGAGGLVTGGDCMMNP